MARSSRGACRRTPAPSGLGVVVEVVVVVVVEVVVVIGVGVVVGVEYRPTQAGGWTADYNFLPVLPSSTC